MIDIITLGVWTLLLMLGGLYVLGRTRGKRLSLVDVYFVTIFISAVLFLHFEYLDMAKANYLLKEWNWEKTQKIQALDKQRVELANSNYELKLEDSKKEGLKKQVEELNGYLANCEKDKQNIGKKAYKYQELVDSQMLEVRQSLQNLKNKIAER